GAGAGFSRAGWGWGGGAGRCLGGRPRPSCLPRLDSPLLLVLELEQPDRVAARVDEPGRQREPDVRDAVSGLEAGFVVLGDLDATSEQLGDLRRDIVDAPARLRLRLVSPHGAPRNDWPGVPAALKGHEFVAFDEEIES